MGGQLGNMRHSSCGLKYPKCRNCHRYLFLCGHLKNLIYEATVETKENLIARILAAPKTSENTPRIFKSIFPYKAMQLIYERKD